MKSFTRVTGDPAPLLIDNVDTDQIIPASFLKVVDREGLVDGLFHGWRFRSDGSEDPDFVLHRPRHRNAEILLVGDNFGCGSSREHAPWALQAWGFRVVVGKGFADIFRGNAHRNGLLTVTLSEEAHDDLRRRAGEGEESRVTVDLETREIELPDGRVEPLAVDPFARHCMLNGVDPLGHLLNHLPAIRRFEAGNPARVCVDTRDGAGGGAT